MSRVASQQRIESLGERLLGLGPGDPCPCCGVRMKAVGTEGTDRAKVSAARTAQAETQSIVCPECGCELEDDEGPAWVSVIRALCPAA